MNAEFSQVGFGSLGWVVGGAGGVPAFFNPGSDTGSWNKIYGSSSATGGQPANRSFNGIDYIFVLHATNDGLRGGGVPEVTASVAGWLREVRAAAGRDTAIFLVVPFGGFGSVNAPAGALKAGFERYQQQARQRQQPAQGLLGPADADPKAFYIDLGRDAAVGLECGAWEHGCVGAYGSKAGASIAGCDGIHPRGGSVASARHGELGAMLAVQATLAMLGGPGFGGYQ